VLNPARDLEYQFALGVLDMPKTQEDVPRAIPSEHALDKDDVVDSPEGIKPVDPHDMPRDTFAEPDDLGVEI
jgi:hypothetical protein